MATIGGSNVIKNGLVLSLDAANVKSYISGSTTWFDLSGNNNTGSLVNGPVFNTGSGGVLVFNGTSSYIAESNFLGSITSSFTIGVWVNFTNANSPTFQKIFHAQSGSNPYSEVNLDNYNGGSGNARYHFYTHAWANNSTNDVLTSSFTITDNAWAQVVGVYDDSTKIKYLYINGTLNNSGSTTVKIDWPNTGSRIGYRLSNAEPLNGSISNFQIHSRALSASEIAQNYNAVKSRFGL